MRKSRFFDEDTLRGNGVTVRVANYFTEHVAFVSGGFVWSDVKEAGFCPGVYDFWHGQTVCIEMRHEKKPGELS